MEKNGERSDRAVEQEGGSMSDEMTLVQNEDGTFSTYNDTYDIVIHCETEEEQKKVIEHLRGIKLQED